MDRYQFIDGVGVYFVTFTITEWLPIFISEEPVKIITDSLLFCIQQKNLRVNAYVIMPNHIHLIVFDARFDNNNLQKTLGDFRKFTGRKIADYCDKRLSKELSDVLRCRDLEDRERQVWQPGWHAEGLASDKFLKQKMAYIHRIL